MRKCRNPLGKRLSDLGIWALGEPPRRRRSRGPGGSSTLRAAPARAESLLSSAGENPPWGERLRFALHSFCDRP
jgi:hypothetical protein